nr:reverse transcriptase domain-containing protein [Tanacetum cinerariifolium]
MSGCGNDQKLKYIAGLFIGKALMWWNSQIHTRGRETIVGMAWEDFKTLMREEFCLNNEMQKLETKLWNHATIRAGHATYTDRFLELARLVHHLVTPENNRIERNGSLKRNPKRRGNGGEPSRERNGKDDNKRTRIENAVATTANLMRREYFGAAPKCEKCNLHHSPGSPCRACFNCNRFRHLLRIVNWHLRWVLALEKAKITQDKVLTRLKLRVRRLENKRKAKTSQPMKMRLFKGRVETSTDKSLGSTADQVSTARPEGSTATPSTPHITTTIFGDEDLTIAQTLLKLRSKKAKEKGVAFRDVKEPPRLTRSTTTLQPLPTIDPKDKGVY